MNLKSRMVRLPIAALGACTLVTAAGVVTAGSAFAATLSLSATSATITNAGVDTNDRAEATFGTQVGGGGTTAPLRAAVTGPTGGAVLFDQVAAGTNPAAADTWDSVAVSTAIAGSGTALTGNYVATKNLYLSATVPGTYTVKIFQDGNANNQYDNDTLDSGAPSFTLTVKDVVNNTSTTSDDLALSIAAPSAIGLGEVVAAKVTAADLTTSDARGNASGQTYGALGAQLDDILTVAFAGAGVADAAGATTFNGTTFNRTSSTATTQGTLVTTAALRSVSKTNSTSVADNTVTGVAFSNTDTANVDYPALNGAAKVRVGTSSVTYRARATRAAGATPVGGATVFFRVLPSGGGSPAIVAGDLTTSAGTPDSDGDVAVTTDNDGYASVTVTSAKTAAANAYTVIARSNGANSGTITATYAAAAPTAITTSSVSALVGGSAKVEGELKDQFGELYSPGAGVQAILTVDRNSTTVVATDFTENANISGGKFSVTVPDLAANTTARTDAFNWDLSSVTFTATADKLIEWVTSVTPASVTATSIDEDGTPNKALPLVSGDEVVPATHLALNSATLKGVIKDSNGTVLKFADFTLTGSSGVYFQDKNGKLVTTLTARSTNTGLLSADESTDGVEVVFTKTGTATVSIKSGSITTPVTLPVKNATDAWRIELNPAKGNPGSNITVRGQVFDAFDNPVVGQAVSLSLPNADFGAFTTTTTPTTDSSGSFTAIYTSGSADSGEVDVKATYGGGGTGAVAGTIGGLTYKAQVKEATEKITVGDQALVLDSSSQLTYGSSYYARGAKLTGGGANSGATVDIFAKVPGGSYNQVESVKANDEGEFTVYTKISKSTYFLAKSGSASSSPSATRVYSRVILSATSSKADRVTLSANGGPNATAYLYFYRVFANGDTDYLGRKLSNAAGNGSATFKAPSGNRKYKVTYKSPGTTTGSDTDPVKVK